MHAGILHLKKPTGRAGLGADECGKWTGADRSVKQGTHWSRDGDWHLPFGVAAQVVPDQKEPAEVLLAPVRTEEVLVELQVAVRHERDGWSI